MISNIQFWLVKPELFMNESTLPSVNEINDMNEVNITINDQKQTNILSDLDMDDELNHNAMIPNDSMNFQDPIDFQSDQIIEDVQLDDC